MTPRALAGLAAALAAGCTFADGDPFATLAPTLDARYAPAADRDVGDGWQKLASDYQVRLMALSIELSPIELVDTGAGDTLSFDPADPPPGYSLCHNGHCHADDGRLVPYEEIAAELAGGGQAPAPIVALAPPSSTIDLFAGLDAPLACTPGCELPRAHVGFARATASALHVAGSVRDGRTSPRLAGEHGFALTLPLPAGVVLRGALDLPIDRTHAPHVALRLTLPVGVGLLDDVDWASLPPGAGDTLALDDPGAAATAARASIVTGAAEFELGAAVTR